MFRYPRELELINKPISVMPNSIVAAIVGDNDNLRDIEIEKIADIVTNEVLFYRNNINPLFNTLGTKITELKDNIMNINSTINLQQVVVPTFIQMMDEENYYNENRGDYTGDVVFIPKDANIKELAKSLNDFNPVISDVKKYIAGVTNADVQEAIELLNSSVRLDDSFSNYSRKLSNLGTITNALAVAYILRYSDPVDGTLGTIDDYERYLDSISNRFIAITTGIYRMVKRYMEETNPIVVIGYEEDADTVFVTSAITNVYRAGVNVDAVLGAGVSGQKRVYSLSDIVDNKDTYTKVYQDHMTTIITKGRIKQLSIFREKLTSLLLSYVENSEYPELGLSLRDSKLFLINLLDNDEKIMYTYDILREFILGCLYAKTNAKRLYDNIEYFKSISSAMNNYQTDDKIYITLAVSKLVEEFLLKQISVG